MPKHLYLFRHAQSVEKQLREHDRDRELSPTGVQEALQMGAYFSRENLKFDIIITSTAARAKATAQMAADSMKFDLDKIISDDELYEASVRTMLEFINNLDDHYHHVMCVGHNPTLSYLAEYVTKAEIGDMVPAGVAIIKFNISSWREVSQGNGELINYIYPPRDPNS
jgi:phosphohistidine phosphatase